MGKRSLDTWEQKAGRSPRDGLQQLRVPSSLPVCIQGGPSSESLAVSTVAVSFFKTKAALPKTTFDSASALLHPTSLYPPHPAPLTSPQFRRPPRYPSGNDLLVGQ